jgi:hypothetical protein
MEEQMKLLGVYMFVCLEGVIEWSREKANHDVTIRSTCYAESRNVFSFAPRPTTHRTF